MTNKVAQAVEKFMSEIVDAERPYVLIAGFINQLKGDPAWSDSEIAEVRSELLRRTFRGGGSTKSQPGADAKHR